MLLTENANLPLEEKANSELLKLAVLNIGSNAVEWTIRLRALQEISLCSTDDLVALAASRTRARVRNRLRAVG